MLATYPAFTGRRDSSVNRIRPPRFMTAVLTGVHVAYRTLVPNIHPRAGTEPEMQEINDAFIKPATVFKGHLAAEQPSDQFTRSMNKRV